MNDDHLQKIIDEFTDPEVVQCLNALAHGIGAKRILVAVAE